MMNRRAEPGPRNPEIVIEIIRGVCSCAQREGVRVDEISVSQHYFDVLRKYLNIPENETVSGLIVNGPTSPVKVRVGT